MVSKASKTIPYVFSDGKNNFIKTILFGPVPSLDSGLGKERSCKVGE